MLPHWGQGCGADKVVAFNSTSGAVNVFPQSENLKSVYPLNIMLYFKIKSAPSIDEALGEAKLLAVGASPHLDSNFNRNYNHWMHKRKKLKG